MWWKIGYTQQLTRVSKTGLKIEFATPIYGAANTASRFRRASFVNFLHRHTVQSAPPHGSESAIFGISQHRDTVTFIYLPSSAGNNRIIEEVSEL